MKGKNTLTRALLMLIVSVTCVIFGMCIPSVAKETRVTITEYKNEIIGDDAGGMTVRYNADGTIMVRDVSGVKVKNDAK